MASFRNIDVFDPSSRLLREVTARAGADVVAPAVRDTLSQASAGANSDRVVSAFLNHRIVTHLIRQFESAGIEIGAMSVADTIWRDCSTSTVVPPIERDSSNRVPLTLMKDRLEHHRDLQRRVIALLAEAVPMSFLVMFGQGIMLAHPEYHERFSHDIDLVVSTASQGEAMVAELNGLGFATTEDRTGAYLGVPFRDWELDAPDLEGHKMHVDLSTGAITRIDSWMKPVVLPDLFDAARVVSLSDPAQRVLVPNDTHQLVLLAEKLQRTQRYDNRVRCDANALLRFGQVDLGFVTDLAQRSDLSNSLRWALGRGRDAGSHRGLFDLMNELLIGAMARNTHGPSRLHKPAAKVFRRVCV